jgi:ureidoacrylate peracid hydrolase
MRALVVIDMQNGFCHPEGSLAHVGMKLADVDRAVATTAEVVADARRNGAPVIFTRHVYRPGRPDEGPSAARLNPRLAQLNGLVAGTWDDALTAELGVLPEDLTVDKVRFDAFLWTSLDPLLRGLGVTELVLAGVVTNIGVESTARSAFMHDHEVTVLSDCCAAQTPRLHEMALEALDACGLATITSADAGFTFAREKTLEVPAAAMPTVA